MYIYICICITLFALTLLYTSFFFFLLYMVFIHVIVHVCKIIDLAAAFQKPMRELRCALESVDSGYPNQHYNKYVDTVLSNLKVTLYSVPMMVNMLS